MTWKNSLQETYLEGYFSYFTDKFRRDLPLIEKMIKYLVQLIILNNHTNFISLSKLGNKLRLFGVNHQASLSLYKPHARKDSKKFATCYPKRRI